MKILVTGGTGYIGSHVAVELIAAGYTVEILDNLANSKEGVLERIQKISGVRPRFYQADLTNSAALERILAEGEFDAVMHFAGLKAVAESVEEPLKYYDINVGGTVKLLAAMREFRVKNFVFSSSATVYGEPGGSGVCTEEMPTGRGIANPYGRTKYMVEEILKDACAADSEFTAVALRYFNPVGAHPSGMIGENPNGRPNNLMPIVMRVARGEYPELTVYGNDYATTDGTCIRDYIHVVDLAKGHLAALQKMQGGPKMRGGFFAYNLGTGRGTSVLEMVAAFEKASGRKLPYRIGERRVGDLPVLYADTSLAEAELGWKTERTIDDAMRDTLKFMDSMDEF